jgi:cystathionine beta-lyase
VQLFPSGLAALAGAMLAVLGQGDEVLVADAIYKPTRRFCDRVLTRFGITVRYFPACATADEVVSLAGPAARLIVMESPASLTFEMQDAPAIARAAKARNILTLMDNTWAAGRLFKPLAHGIDISVQSLTKYVAGHADVFMGSAAATDPMLCGALDRAVEDFGWAVSADEAYQVLRGLRTLDTRMARHQASALEIAQWLRARPEVADLLYPALPQSPGHALWNRDYTGAAGVFSVVLRPCKSGAVEAFLNALRLFGLGFSWGGFESLALNCDPQFGVRTWPTAYPGPVIRLSIGLEDPADLIADLERGFGALSD